MSFHYPAPDAHLHFHIPVPLVATSLGPKNPHNQQWPSQKGFEDHVSIEKSILVEAKLQDLIQFKLCTYMYIINTYSSC